MAIEEVPYRRLIFISKYQNRKFSPAMKILGLIIILIFIIPNNAGPLSHAVGNPLITPWPARLQCLLTRAKQNVLACSAYANPRYWIQKLPPLGVNDDDSDGSESSWEMFSSDSSTDDDAPSNLKPTNEDKVGAKEEDLKVHKNDGHNAEAAQQTAKSGVLLDYLFKLLGNLPLKHGQDCAPLKPLMEPKQICKEMLANKALLEHGLRALKTMKLETEQKEEAILNVEKLRNNADKEFVQMATKLLEWREKLDKEKHKVKFFLGQ